MAEKDFDYKKEPQLSKVKIGGTDYYLKDAEARTVIDTILNDYLKGADKTELLGKITAEETRATNAEAVLQGLIDALEAKDVELAAAIAKEVSDRAAAITQEVADRNTAIANAINALDVTDTAVEGQYVSAVKEVDGKIEVSRTALPVAAEYTIVKQETPESGMASTYYLTKDSVQVGAKINIAKDQFLKEAHFYAKAEDVPSGVTPPAGQEFPALRLVFEVAEGKNDIWIAVKELVDTYTAGAGIKIENNVITAVVKSGDKYIEVTADGIASKGIDAAIADAVAAEKDRAEDAEKDLDDKIKAETSRAVGEEGKLDTAIKAEATTARAAEQANAAAIETLDGRMDTAESDIDALEGRMTTAEADIDANTAAIAAEKTRAEGEEAAIRSEFAAADATLDGKITAEATARANADTAINTKIGAKTDATTADTVYGAINKEVARATAAEEALDDRIDALDAGAFKNVSYVDASHKLQKTIGSTTSDVHTFGDLADENLANLEVKGQTKSVVFTSNSVDVKEYTVADAATSTNADITRADYKPAGEVNVTLSGNSFNAITSVGSMPEYTKENVTGGKATVIDTTKFNGGSVATFTEGAFTPASITYAASDEFVKEGLKVEVGTGADAECLIFSAVTNKGTASVISAFNGGSKAKDTFNGGAVASLGDGFYTAGSDVVYTASQWTAGVAPTMAAQTVGVQSSTFEGTTETGLKVSNVAYKKQVLNDSTVTKTVSVAGTVTTDDKAVTKKA